jgi:hypothetical protein
MSQPTSIPGYRTALKAAEARIACLEAETAQLKQRVRKLERQLEAAQRAGKRQAAPFSRESGSRAGGRLGAVRPRNKTWGGNATWNGARTQERLMGACAGPAASKAST